jgi:hypothetical protein
MKYYDPQIKAFVIVGVHGGKFIPKYTHIETKVGVDQNGEDITVEKDFIRGYTAADIPDHWLVFEDSDPRFGSHPGKKLTYSEEENDLVLEEIPALSAERVAAKQWQNAKAERDIEIKSIVVEIDSIPFDGDELSQERMSRAINLANGDTSRTTPWKGADNQWRTVTADQLNRALSAAAEKQIEIMQAAEL